MRKSIKAPLLSGLVFPGTGQFSLHLGGRAMIFFLPSLVSLIVLVHYSLSKAYAVVDLIEQGKVPLDTGVITNLISAPPVGAEMLKIQIATWVIIVCWLASIVDAYRQGRIADKKDN